MWHDVNDIPPAEGIPVAVLDNNKVSVAFYCDTGFYTLVLDPVLGIMRKTFLDPVKWAELHLPKG